MANSTSRDDQVIVDVIKGLKKIRDIVVRQRSFKADVGDLVTKAEESNDILVKKAVNCVQDRGTSPRDEDDARGIKKINKVSRKTKPSQVPTRKPFKLKRKVARLKPIVSDESKLAKKISSSPSSKGKSVNNIEDKCKKCCLRKHKQSKDEKSGKSRSMSNLPVEKLDTMISEAKVNKQRFIEEEEKRLTIKYCRKSKRFYDGDDIRCYINERRNKQEEKPKEECHEKCRRSIDETAAIREFIKKKKLERRIKAIQEKKLTARKVSPRSISSLSSSPPKRKAPKKTKAKEVEIPKKQTIEELHPNHHQISMKTLSKRHFSSQSSKSSVQNTGEKKSSLSPTKITPQMRELLKSLIEFTPLTPSQNLTMDSTRKLSSDKNTHSSRILDNPAKCSGENQFDEKISSPIDTMSSRSNLNETFVKTFEKYEREDELEDLSPHFSPQEKVFESSSGILRDTADRSDQLNQTFTKEKPNISESIENLVTNAINSVPWRDFLPKISASNETFEKVNVAILSTIVEESLEISENSSHSNKPTHKSSSSGNDHPKGVNEKESLATSTLLDRDSLSPVSSTKNSPSPISLPLNLIEITPKSAGSRQDHSKVKDQDDSSISPFSNSFSLCSNYSLSLSVDSQIMTGQLISPIISSSSPKLLSHISSIAQAKAETIQNKNVSVSSGCRITNGQEFSAKEIQQHWQWIDDDRTDNLSSLQSDEGSIPFSPGTRKETSSVRFNTLEDNLVEILVKDIAKTMINYLSEHSTLRGINLSQQPNWPDEVQNLRKILLDICRDIVDQKLCNSNVITNFDQLDAFLLKEVKQFINLETFDLNPHSSSHL